MNSKELMDRAWQYDIVGMLGFVLSNTASSDFGRIFFVIFGSCMIIGSLFVMLYAFKKTVREQEAQERLVREIAEMALGKKKSSKKTPQKTAKGGSTNKVGKYIKTKNKRS